MKYKATISFISRHNTRTGQWSTIGCKRVLDKLGYTPVTVAKLVQEVHFSGTKNEIIEQRTKITKALKRYGGRNFAIRFEVKKLPLGA